MATTTPTRPGPLASPRRPRPTAASRVLHALAIVLAGLTAGILGTIAGPLGTKALAGVGALAIVVVVGYVARAQVRLLRPGRFVAAPPRPPAARRRSRLGGLVLLPVAGVGAGVVAFLAGSLGMKGMLLVVVLCAGVTVAGLYRRELGLLLVGARGGRAPDWAPAPLFDLDRGGKRRQPRPRLSRTLTVLVTIAAIGGAITVAWLGASLGKKGPLAIIGAIVLTAFFAYVRPKTDVVLFLVPCSLVLFLHKSFSEFQLVNSGAPAVYITSLGAITLLLYGFWAREGTMRDDLRATFRRPIMWAPLAGAFLFLPSLLVAVNMTLSIAELVRMVWMYLLFVYLAAKVRRRSQILLILLGLGLFAGVELVVTVLQWKTGGVLGLGFLGVPTTLGERVVNDGSIGRPFGTIVHPVFLGATMGAVALLFLALGLHVREKQAKVVLLALVPVSAVPMLLAQSRAAIVAFAPVALAVVVHAAMRKRITPTAIRRGAVIGLVLGVAFFPTLKAKYDDNFGTNHFSLEVESRVQLNELAYQMIADHPGVGVGLNNFQQVQPRYDNYGLLFAGNPVHNLYLLQIAETGYIGLLGLLLVGGSLFVLSVRLARLRDPLYSGLGTAMAAIIVFFAVEELLGFSLRQEIPLALWWLLSGIVVAASMMHAEQGSAPRRRLRVAPAGGPNGSGARRELVGAAPSRSGNGNGNGHRPANGNGNGNGNANGNGHHAANTGLQASPPAWRELEPSEPIEHASEGPAWRDAPGGAFGVALHADQLDRAVRAVARELRTTPVGRRSTDGIDMSWLDELVEAFQDLGPSADGTRDSGGRHRRSVPRPRRAAAAGVIMSIVGALFLIAPPSVATSTSRLKIVFAATDRRVGGEQGIFVATGDGAQITRITPNNGLHYDFPQWALGGTKIIYSMRAGPFGSPQNIFMMNPDGSGVQALTTSPWRNDQPKVSPDGQTVIFSRHVAGTRLTAIFEMDLRTLLTHSLSAEHSRSVTADADPRFANDGRIIVFARSRDDVGEHKTQAYRMNRDGTGYTRLTQDDHYDVDPSMAPNGAELAVSSYQGPGSPKNDASPLQARQEDFHLLVRNLTTGVDRNLTQGLACSTRAPETPCRPEEGSAYTPLWTPDGSEIGYVSALDSLRVCICLIGRDGTDARTVVAEPGLSISYFDWVVPSAAPVGSVPTPGLEAPTDRLLIAGNATASETDATTTPFLRATTRDVWNQVTLPVPAGLAPRFAKWTKDRSTMVFSAFVPGDVPPPPATPPAAPPGQTRHEHFTIEAVRNLFKPPVERPNVAREQVYLATPDGLRQLTGPYLEDWQDALEPGDARGNTEPDISPDGRYVVMTNVSSISNESFILRLDLTTGEVLNLTNGTAGAIPTDDAQPRYSADGQTIAFTASVAGHPQIMVMDAADGKHVRKITDDQYFNTAPAWSPDGRTIVYTSFRGNGLALLASLLLPAETRHIPLDGWYLVKVDVASGRQTVLTQAADSPAFSPVYSPDGTQIAFVSITDSLQPDVYVIDADADVTGHRARPDLITVLDQELSIDWK